MAEEILVLMADLDEESQRIMGGWYGKLHEKGFTGVQTPNLPFHITLACFALDKEQEVVEEMEELAKRFPAIPVHMSHMGLFAGGKVRCTGYESFRTPKLASGGQNREAGELSMDSAFNDSDR